MHPLFFVVHLSIRAKHYAPAGQMMVARACLRLNLSACQLTLVIVSFVMLGYVRLAMEVVTLAM